MKLRKEWFPVLFREPLLPQLHEDKLKLKFRFQVLSTYRMNPSGRKDLKKMTVVREKLVNESFILACLYEVNDKTAI